ncbi:tetratricopeptide repeat protein [Mesorhizobium sp. NBSH29]|uniref:tetratricopeptide repeat protein n=1 Tax=Mesorhizobium sp. NBSH29 TaxID=2654249 RepID=UPI001896667E|nr:tetratricopeptide repeat protein [Mesorhizobium sp. NBSH29]QPC88388.1 tetratricopeptide repeat protein [Mesorhizobium sp. NBSH29]
MRTRLVGGLASILVTIPLLAGSAYAMGENTGPADTVPTCKNGSVWDKNKKKCVPKTSALDDDSIYETGRSLAKLGRYGEAITILSLANNKADPRILNYLGYSHRKQGRVQVGVGYYREALRQDPNYTLVREYLGEAQLQLGNVAAAREQLGEIEKRCGKACPEYTELSGEIAAHVKG